MDTPKTPENPRLSPVPRREMLIRILRLGGLSASAVAAGVWLNSRSRRPEDEAPLALARSITAPADARFPEMVVAQGEDPRALVRKALDALGGVRRFIARGDVVVIKP